MNITVSDLTNLLWGARAEGYDEAVNQAKFASGDANVQTNTACQEYVETPNTELPLPEDVNPDEEAFALYSDGFDDGYSEAIEDVKESLTF
jgi:hypothetical protein